MRKRKRKEADGGKAPGRVRAQTNARIMIVFVSIGTSVDGFVVNGIGRRRIAQRSLMTIERDVFAEKDSHLNCNDGGECNACKTMVSSKKGM